MRRAASGPGRGRKSGQGPGRQRPKVKHKRISLEDFTASLWNVAARIAMQVDVPIGRCLAFQAPIAGLVLEDVIRDTAVDPVLQVAARAQEKGKMVAALIGPPAIVGAIRMAQGLEEPQRSARMAVLLPMLRESMVLSVRIAGDKAEQILAREAELGPVYETVDRQLAAIFAGAEPWTMPAPDGAAAEDQAAEAAAAFVAG